MTTEQASVVLSERLDDGWQPLSTRLDETGHLVTGLVGLTLTQFCQVALLPQGTVPGVPAGPVRGPPCTAAGRSSRPVASTGSSSGCASRRLDLQRSSATHGRTVAHLVGRVSETAAQPLPTAGTSPTSRWRRPTAVSRAGSAITSPWPTRTSGRPPRPSAEADLRRAHRPTSLDAEPRAGRSTGRPRRRRGPAGRARRGRTRRPSRAAATSRARGAAGRARGRRGGGCRPGDAAATRGRRVTASWLRIAAADQRSTDRRATCRASSRGASCPRRRRRGAPDAERLHEVTPACATRWPTCWPAPPSGPPSCPPSSRRAPVRLREAEAALAAAESAEQRLPALRTTLATARERADAADRGGRGRVRPSRRPAATATPREHASPASGRPWLDLREARLNGMAAEIAGRSRSGPVAPSAVRTSIPILAVASVGSPDADLRTRRTQGRRRRRSRAGRPRRPAAAVRGPAHPPPDPRRGPVGRRRRAGAGRVRALHTTRRLPLAAARADVRGEVMRRRTDRATTSGRRETSRCSAGRTSRRGWSCTAPSTSACATASTRSWTAPAARASRRCGSSGPVSSRRWRRPARPTSSSPWPSATWLVPSGPWPMPRPEPGSSPSPTRVAHGSTRPSATGLAAELDAADEALRAARAVLDDPDHHAAAALPRPDVATPCRRPRRRRGPRPRCARPTRRGRAPSRPPRRPWPTR